MIDGDRKQQESMGRLVQGLRSELETSRRQITDLTIKDSKAADAILALERKAESMRTEAAQLQAQNANLNKDLKSSQVGSTTDRTAPLRDLLQVEVLRVQQELNAMTEKMVLYKNRLSTLRKEMSEYEKNAQERGSHGSRLAKPPEYYALQERVQMLEEEIVAERNSHSITKNMLRQESEHRKALRYRGEG